MLIQQLMPAGSHFRVCGVSVSHDLCITMLPLWKAILKVLGLVFIHTAFTYSLSLNSHNYSPCAGGKVTTPTWPPTIL